MYVAVKGGERAIENAHRLLAHERRGDHDVPELSLSQISEQLSLGVDRVMTEGSLYDRELAALAIKQARGDMIEAIFLVRASRATLPRFGATEPVESVTRPVIVDVPICPKAASAVARNPVISLFMDHPPNGGHHITNRSLRVISPASHRRGSYPVIAVYADISR